MSHETDQALLEPADATLMQRIARGDRVALGQLAQRHQGRIRALAYRFCGRSADADDLVQETFLRLWRAADQYHDEGHLSTWMYRIVANLCLDAGRRRRGHRLARLDDVPETSLADDVPVGRSLETAEIAARVKAAVAVLPERQRMVVLFHRYEGLSHKQIAETTGWSESAVESLLVRAYAFLRERLADLGPGA